MVIPDRVAFTLFGKEIYWYGVLMALGILIAVWLTLKEGKRKKLTEDDMLDMCLVTIPCGVIGARLYYVIFEWQQYAANPISALYIWEGGLAIYGAVIGGLLGMFIYSRVKKHRFLKLADCIAPGLVLAQAIGRWGNFFNQEAFGLAINNDALKWFPFAVYIDGYHTFNGQVCSNPYHMATFFYESMWCLLVFVILWACRKKFKHDGDALLTYAMLYGLERMLVEPLRGDSLYLIQPGTLFAGGIRVSQLLSFVMVVAVLVFFVVRAAREKKLGQLIWPAPEAVVEEEVSEEAAAETETAVETTEEQTEEATDAANETKAEEACAEGGSSGEQE